MPIIFPSFCSYYVNFIYFVNNEYYLNKCCQIEYHHRSLLIDYYDEQGFYWILFQLLYDVIITIE